MSEYRRQTIVASVIAAIVVLSIGVGVYYIQPQILALNTITYIVANHPNNLPSSAQVTNSTLGLNLTLSLDGTMYKPGQSVSITIAEYNLFGTTNNVSSQKHWPLSGLTLGGCGTLNYPFGISIFQGNYGPNNLSMVSHQAGLLFYQPGMYSCPAVFFVKSYLFAPSSDEAALGLSPNGTVAGFPMASAVSTNGSWTPYTSGYPGTTSRDFSDGMYTVVAGDEWGDVVVLQYVVSASSELTETTSTSNAVTFTSFTTTSSAFEASTTNSTLGLELILSLNATEIQTGQAITVTTSVSNILQRVNNVSGASRWALPALANWSYSAFPCPNWYNFLVFSGYYSIANISSAGGGLHLFPPGVVLPCPYRNFSSFVFEPSSDNVAVGNPPNPSGTFSTQENSTIVGYYTTAQGYVTSNRILPPPPFPRGAYTIVAGDEWGQIALLHFVVTGSSQVTETQTSGSSVAQTHVQIGNGSGIVGGDWRFVSSTNGSAFKVGETVDLSSTLTYIGSHNSTASVVVPILVFDVESSNGTKVFSGYPPQITQRINVTPGLNFTQSVSISTRGWQTGTYTIMVYPEIFPNGNLTISFTLS